MTKFIDRPKALDPTILITLALTFAAGLIVGQQTTSREVEVIYHNPYQALTLDECVTEYECNIAQLLDDQAQGRFVSTDDPRFFPDSVPVIEPIDCEPNDKECEEANKNSAGKSAVITHGACSGQTDSTEG